MRWSYSAHRMVRRCQRQYAFDQVVASHNSKDPFRREVFTLKQLQSLAMWQGSLVHKTLATQLPVMISRDQPIDASVLVADAMDLRDRQFEFSRDRRYRDDSVTKTAAGDVYCALLDHDRGMTIPKAALEELQDNLRLCFELLAQEKWFVDMVWTGRNHRVEHRVGFSVAGAWVTATLDLVFQDDGGELVIVDWKVTKSQAGGHARQLFLYGLAALESGWWPGIEANDVRLYEANLLQGRFQDYRFDDEKRREADDLVYRSVKEIQALRAPGGYGELDIDELEVAESPGTCALCNYVEACIASFEKAGRKSDAELIQRRLI